MRGVRRTVLACSVGAALSLGLWANGVSATPSPNGPGQPGAPGTTCGDSNATSRPGNAMNAQSPFNPDGNAGLHYAGNPGTASLAHSNSPHAVSQYDIACFQQTQHGH
jgi:hypothetical protein